MTACCCIPGPLLDSFGHCCRCGHDHAQTLVGLGDLFQIADGLRLEVDEEVLRRRLILEGYDRTAGWLAGQHRLRARVEKARIRRGEPTPLAAAPPFPSDAFEVVESKWVDAERFVAFLKRRGLYAGLLRDPYAARALKRLRRGDGRRARVATVDKICTIAGLVLSELPDEVFASSDHDSVRLAA